MSLVGFKQDTFHRMDGVMQVKPGEGEGMNYYKLKYDDGRVEIVKAETDLQVVRKYDLATREHVNTRIFRLEGEQLAIARSNEVS